MQYNSVSNYFARLQAKSLIFLFVSLLMVVLSGYLLLIEKLTDVLPDNPMVAYALAGVGCMDALGVLWVPTIMLKNVRMLASLGERMDRYVMVVYVRFGLLISGTTLSLVAFLMSRVDWLALLPAVCLLLYIPAWPTRQRLCSDLALKPAECDVVFERS